MRRAISIALLLASMLSVPLSTSSADLDHAEIHRANTLSAISAYIREHAPRRAGELTELPKFVVEAGGAYGIDPFVQARLIRESGYDRTALSHVGAIGLAQFLPFTIRMYGMSVAHFRDSIHCQVNLAACYLADLTRRTGARTWRCSLITALCGLPTPRT